MWWNKVAESRKPDFEVVHEGRTYLRRWHLLRRNKWLNVYLHLFLGDDEDEALHDHPWLNVSYLLEGTYTEWTIAAGGVQHSRVLQAGHMRARLPRTAHRIQLHSGPCWSLFITGPLVRTWGFHCRNRWTPWREYKDKRKTGLGCP